MTGPDPYGTPLDRPHPRPGPYRQQPGPGQHGPQPGPPGDTHQGLPSGQYPPGAYPSGPHQGPPSGQYPPGPYPSGPHSPGPHQGPPGEMYQPGPYQPCPYGLGPGQPGPDGAASYRPGGLPVEEPFVDPSRPTSYPTPGGPIPSRRGGAPGTVSRWSYLWAVVPFITFGILAPFPFCFAAIKLRSWWLGAVTAGYTGLVVAGLVADEPDRMDGARTAVFFSCMLITWLVGTAHAFAIRRRVFVRRERWGAGVQPGLGGSPRPAGRPAAPWRESVAGRNAGAMDQVEMRRQLRQQARELAQSDPAAAVELRIGRPDLAGDYDDGGLVDLNHAPESAIAEIPGVGVTVARAIVSARTDRGMFTSADEVDVYADLSPDLTGPLRDYGIFLPG